MNGTRESGGGGGGGGAGGGPPGGGGEGKESGVSGPEIEAPSEPAEAPVEYVWFSPSKNRTLTTRTAAQPVIEGIDDWILLTEPPKPPPQPPGGPLPHARAPRCYFRGRRRGGV